MKTYLPVKSELLRSGKPRKLALDQFCFYYAPLFNMAIQILIKTSNKIDIRDFCSKTNKIGLHSNN